MVGISFAPHAAAVKMCWGKLLVEMNVWYVEWETCEYMIIHSRKPGF